MDSKDKGLYEKYYVRRTNGKRLNGDMAIVLELGDPLTWNAIEQFAHDMKEAGYIKLHDDLITLVFDQRMRAINDEIRDKAKMVSGS